MADKTTYAAVATVLSKMEYKSTKRLPSLVPECNRFVQRYPLNEEDMDILKDNIMTDHLSKALHLDVHKAYNNVIVSGNNFQGRWRFRWYKKISPAIALRVMQIKKTLIIKGEEGIMSLTGDVDDDIRNAMMRFAKDQQYWQDDWWLSNDIVAVKYVRDEIYNLIVKEARLKIS